MQYDLEDENITVVVGDEARMDVPTAINYIESGKAELQPLVTAAQTAEENASNSANSALGYAERAETAAATAENMANKDLSNLSATGEAKFTAKQDVIDASNKLPAAYVSGLATVATSGSYNDLTNKPTIPTVNNAILTIQKNGSNVETFTANASSNVTANITVPTDTGELTNSAGFITSSALSGCQTTANLVTSISSNSTDSQYPSAKCVYDIVGDIENALDAIIAQGSNS